jgi:hypothetical protein
LTRHPRIARIASLFSSPRLDTILGLSSVVSNKQICACHD